jgi:hypothetical protein
MTHILNEMQTSVDLLNERVAKLEIELADLQGEANFYRGASFIVWGVVLILVAERIWHFFFH